MSKARDIADLDFNSPDIDGGNIDGAVIGASTAAAGTFSSMIVNGVSTLNTSSTVFANLNYQGATKGTIGTDGINIKHVANANMYFHINGQDRMLLGGNGDISIYDSSSNAKIFWDADASRLGVGTVDPRSDLFVRNDAANGPARIGISNGGTVGSGTSSRLSFYEGVTETSYVERRRDGSGKTAIVTPATDNPVTIEVNGGNELASFEGAAIVFNENGADQDFRVESSTNINAIKVDGQYSVVGINTGNATSYTTSNSLAVSGRDVAFIGNAASGSTAVQHRFWNNSGTPYEIAQMKVNVGAGQANRGQFQFTVNNGAVLRQWLDVDYLGNVVFNEGSHDSDFRVESNGDTHMFFVDGATNEIGVGTSNPENRMEIRTNDGNTGHTSGLTITNFSLTSDARAGISFRNYDNYGAAIYSPRTGSSQGKLVLGVNAGYNTTQASVQPKLVILHGGGTEQYAFVNDARWFIASSAFSNPTVDLFTGSTNGGNYPQTCFEVTMYGNGVSANEHQVFRGGGTFDYSSTSNGTAQNLTTYTNYHVGNALPAAPTFSLSGNILQMTCYRQTNYDTYRIEVRVWGRSTTQAWGTHQ